MVLPVVGVVLIIVGDFLYVGSGGRVSAALWLLLVGAGACLALTGLTIVFRRGRRSRRPREGNDISPS